MSDTLAIIPARGGSKRLPRKNVRELGGRPLVLRALDAALASGVFARTVISSDDVEVLTLAGDYGVERAADLAGDRVQVKQVCTTLLRELADAGERYERYAVLLPTSPLRTPVMIREAFDQFVASGADTLMSVVRFAHPPQRALKLDEGRLRPAYGAEQMKPAQALEPLYRHDGSIIIGRTEALLASGEFYSDDVVPYEVPAARAVDVDSERDLLLAEFLLEQLSE